MLHHLLLLCLRTVRKRDKTRCASFISLSRRSPHTNTSHSAAAHCSRKSILIRFSALSRRTAVSYCLRCPEELCFPIVCAVSKNCAFMLPALSQRIVLSYCLRCLERSRPAIVYRSPEFTRCVVHALRTFRLPEFRRIRRCHIRAFREDTSAPDSREASCLPRSCDHNRNACCSR